MSGCAQPLPEDRLNYVGDWRSEDMQLVIFADGRVEYQRVQGGMTTSIHAPLKDFSDDGFTAGLLFATTTFDVTVPPHEVNGAWKMTVDGVELTRKSD